MSVQHPRHNGAWRVAVVRKQMGDEYDSEVWEGDMDPQDLDGKAPLGVIGVNLGMTLNLGNYESAKMDVHVSLPFDATKAGAAQEAFDKAEKFASDKVQATRAEITGTDAADDSKGGK